jgi:hypothetical protein
MLAEIALQLAKQNALLESQNSLLDAIRSILNQSLA